MNRAYTDAAEKSHGRSKTAATPQHSREAPDPAAEHRGFLPGYELRDWLGGEAEFDKAQA